LIATAEQDGALAGKVGAQPHKRSGSRWDGMESASPLAAEPIAKRQRFITQLAAVVIISSD